MVGRRVIRTLWGLVAGALLAAALVAAASGPAGAGAAGEPGINETKCADWGWGAACLDVASWGGQYKISYTIEVNDRQRDDTEWGTIAHINVWTNGGREWLGHKSYATQYYWRTGDAISVPRRADTVSLDVCTYNFNTGYTWCPPGGAVWFYYYG